MAGLDTGRGLLWSMALALMVGCGGAASEAATADEAADQAPAETSGGDDPLHAALVDTHREAVEACFGGFGKGAPYSVKLTLSGGAVTGATAAPLAEDGYGQLPSDCIAKHFRAMAVPASVGSSEVSARFAVQTDDCSVPECGERDMPCHFKRDIACSVVIDER